ncbi:TetR/AcrR family transcriptional regulator, partial [Lactococcus lactis]
MEILINTKEKIVNLGLELIQTRGINGFSFADIAKVIDIKKASIHYYFPSKTDLIEAVLEKYSTNFFEALEQSTAST